MSENVDSESGRARPGQPELLPALTGLRFVAAFAVLLFHAATLATPEARRLDLLAAGAVSLFFVLSGFILTWVYYGRLTARGVPAFWWARLARIWPLAAVCLALTVAVRTWTGEYAGKPIFGPMFWTHVGLVQSWIPQKNWALQFNDPAWSVSTELAFYLLFPLLFLPGARRFRGIWMLLLAGTGLALAWMQWQAISRPAVREWCEYMVLVHPAWRLLEFGTGVGAGFLFVPFRTWLQARRGDGGRGAGWWTFPDTLAEAVAVFAVCGSIWLVAEGGAIHEWLQREDWPVVLVWLQRGGAAMFGFALLVWTLGWSRGLLAQFLGTPAMVWLGEVSYAVYLVQMPVIHAFRQLRGGLDMSHVAVIASVMAVSIGLAAWLHGAVERPLRTMLVSLVRRDWKGCRRVLVDAHHSLWSGGTGLLAGVLVVAGSWMFVHDRWQAAGPGSLDVSQLAGVSVLEAGGASLRPTGFRGQAVLHGARAEPVEEGLRLTLVWEVLPGCTMTRFVHVCDGRGEVLAQGLPERARFAAASPHSLVVDQVLLTKQELAGGATVGVGFFEKGAGTAVVERGVQGLDGRRLELLRFDSGEWSWIVGN